MIHYTNTNNPIDFPKTEKKVMNERIRELAEQAQDEVVDSDCADYYERIQLKFAELIVRECIEVVKWTLSQFSNDECVKNIKEHFGVEE